ncbi:MAG: hypothetical protein IPP04_10605 [Saprospiraceae bacterium]|nr:hypothetical protein [Saprospiraceae bacterium]
MAKLFIHDHPLTDDELALIRAKRFLSLSPQDRIRQMLSLISCTLILRKSHDLPKERLIIKPLLAVELKKIHSID